MKPAIAIVTGLACACAAVSAQAATSFQFREIFPMGSVGGVTITGTFQGDLAGGRITNLSNVSLFRDGRAFRGNGTLYTLQFDFKTRRWQEGGYLSLDGSANNIMFIDTDYGAGDSGFFNYFYSVTGLGNAAFQPSYYRYRVPQTTRMTVIQVPDLAQGVPEPAAWALLVIGFGAAGAAMRRRRGMAARVSCTCRGSGLP